MDLNIDKMSYNHIERIKLQDKYQMAKYAEQ